MQKFIEGDIVLKKSLGGRVYLLRDRYGTWRRWYPPRGKALFYLGRGVDEWYYLIHPLTRGKRARYVVLVSEVSSLFTGDVIKRTYWRELPPDVRRKASEVRKSLRFGETEG